MAEQLGKIEKLGAQHFNGKRKLYLVPLIFSGEEAPSEYWGKFNLYWGQISQHIVNMKSKISEVSQK